MNNNTCIFSLYDNESQSLSYLFIDSPTAPADGTGKLGEESYDPVEDTDRYGNVARAEPLEDVVVADKQVLVERECAKVEKGANTRRETKGGDNLAQD